MAISAVLQGLIARALLRLPDKTLVKMSGGAAVVKGGRTLDARIQFLAHGARNQKPMHELEPAVARIGMEQSGALIDARPHAHVTMRDLQVDGGEPGGGGPGVRLNARLYMPSQVSHKPPLMVWLHQGGCVIGSLATAHPWCSALCDEANVAVLSVDYRLAPEHRFPASVDDALAALRWARAHADELGVDPLRIGIGGDSAGGYLSATVCQLLKKAGEAQPVLQLLIYPNTDATMTGGSLDIYGDAFPLNVALMRWFYGHYLNSESERSDVRVSPGLARDLSGLAPARIYTAGFDPLLDQGAAYAGALQAAGVPVAYHCFDSLAHGFTMMSGVVPVAASAVARIAHETGHALRAVA